MKNMLKVIIDHLTSDFSQKNLGQSIIWKAGAMKDYAEDTTLEKVASQIVELEAEIGDGERTTQLESKEDFLVTVDEQIAELVSIIPLLKAAYKKDFGETYTERKKSSGKPRSAKVTALLAKRNA